MLLDLPPSGLDSNHTEIHQNESKVGCFTVTSELLTSTTAVIFGVNSLTSLACIIAIILIVFLKAYKKLLIRLVLYLNLSVFCFMVAEITQFLPVKLDVNDTLVIQNEDFCTATAFFGEFFGTLVFFSQCSMALYLILLTTSKNKNLHSRTREICGVITAVTIASVMATIPLIPFDGDTAYGLYGFNCWIAQKNDRCERSTVGLIEHVLLWNVPLGATLVFIMVALVFAVSVLCKKTTKQPSVRIQRQHNQALQEARTLAVYMSILTIIYLAEVTVHVTYIISSGNNLNLRLAGFVIETVLFALVPAAFVFHPATLKRLRCSELRQTINKWRGIHDDEVYTSYHVPPEPEFSECSDLVVTSSDRNRHDSSYRSMLERPVFTDAEI